MVPIFGLISGRIQRAGPESPNYSEASCLRVYCGSYEDVCWDSQDFEPGEALMEGLPAVDEPLCIYSGQEYSNSVRQAL
jgi:hypothetical protein